MVMLKSTGNDPTLVDHLREKMNRYFTRTRGEIRPGVFRMERLLSALGHVFNTTTVRVLVCGTNGKGTFCAQLERICRDAGYVTGLYTSPHLISPCERIRVKGLPIGEDDLLFLLEKCEAAASKSLPDATYFELMTAAAFLKFHMSKTQIDIVEVGLGGRLDSTNIVPLSFSVITSIGLDHCEILGTSLEQIGYEKGCASRRNKPLICAETNPDALLGIAKATVLTGSELIMSGDPVQTAISILNERHNLNLSNDQVSKSLAHYCWPGRTDLRRVEFAGNSCDVLFDAAHNAHGMAHFLKNYTQQDRNLTIVFASLSDKDWQDSLMLLNALNAKFIFTACTQNPRSVPAKELYDFFINHNLKKRSDVLQSHLYFESIPAALQAAFKKPFELRDQILILGSIALLGECMDVLKVSVFEKENS